MPAPRIFTAENRLASILGGPHDPTIEQLTERAERKVEAMRENTRTYVIDRLRRIAALADQPEAEVFAHSTALSAAALEICEVAASAGMVMVGEAARALYTMLSALNLGVWHTDALKLHIQTLSLIAITQPPTQTAQALLVDLKKVRDRVGVPE